MLASRSGTLAAVTTTALSLKYQRQCGVFGLPVHEGFVKPDPLMNPRCNRNTLTIDNGLRGTLATVIIGPDSTAQTLRNFDPGSIFTPIAQIGVQRWLAEEYLAIYSLARRYRTWR